jgi:sugar (pentulose or hexulose) kinase
MQPIPVIAIFDVGKTNKKLFLFNEQYQIVYEKTVQFAEVVDEDGDACENLASLTEWGSQSLKELMAQTSYDIRALNFSAYGASFVHIGKDGKPLTVLYNYLKTYPKALQDHFYDQYEGRLTFSQETASPVLGHLNSGLQLYWLQAYRKQVFQQIDFSLHLPQYLSYLITGMPYSDITSIGCHTGLWNFKENYYHRWVNETGIEKKLAPIFGSDEVVEVRAFWKTLQVGIGLHDSSAALIPYLAYFPEPFILISTGTWCISLNPFNNKPLTDIELQQDCLCYLTYKGEPVKASRLFAGNEHEVETKRLSTHFNLPIDYFKQVDFNESCLNVLQQLPNESLEGSFAAIDLSQFDNYETAYHILMFSIMQQQKRSTHLVLNDGNTRRIFVDGGFSKNVIYMNLLAKAFPEMEVYAAAVAQATAVGAALAIHGHWNTKTLPADLIDLKYYAKPTI